MSFPCRRRLRKRLLKSRLRRVETLYTSRISVLGKLPKEKFRLRRGVLLRHVIRLRQRRIKIIRKHYQYHRFHPRYTKNYSLRTKLYPWQQKQLRQFSRRRFQRYNRAQSIFRARQHLQLGSHSEQFPANLANSHAVRTPRVTATQHRFQFIIKSGRPVVGAFRRAKMAKYLTARR